MFTLTYSPEVMAARENGTPIVALESTIITHGMPFPQNVETAREVEQVVRDNGATPATIAILNGTLHVGLSDTELMELAQAKNVAKVSRADMPVCIATGGYGATTVAATMIAAHLAGIKVFATGGIGGVHRGAEETFDISADLGEFAETPVTVVAAGAKAILDIPKTLEVLETYGVPVITVGQDELPAFWSRRSGIPTPLRIDDPAQIARAQEVRSAMGLKGGQLIANPIPQDAEITREEINPVIEDALVKAEAERITAKNVTPFLLGAMYEATEGRSLVANIALVKNNARLAAEIAKSFTKSG